MTSCQPLEALQSLAGLPLESPRRAAIEAHLVRCPACRRRLAELQQADEPTVPVPKELVERLAPHGTGGRRGAAWAAAGLLAAGLATLVVWTGRGPEPEMPTGLRGGETTPARIELLSPADGKALEGVVRFAWRTAGELEQCRLLVLDESGTILLERVADGATLEVAATELGAGTRYWYVETQSRAGSRIQSPVSRFELRAGPGP